MGKRAGRSPSRVAQGIRFIYTCQRCLLTEPAFEAGDVVLPEQTVESLSNDRRLQEMRDKLESDIRKNLGMIKNGSEKPDENKEEEKPKEKKAKK